METLRKNLLDGIDEMIGLCEQCKKLVEAGEINHNLSDILAEELPDKSESLFKTILRSTHPELVP